MKQGIRFLVKPGTFFNQLQWSTHHWFILLAFVAIATIETQVGKQHLFYEVFADRFARSFNVSWDTALWMVTSLRLIIMVAGTLVLASLIWAVGNVFGRRTSRRVLFRRFAVVSTVLLAAYTANHLVNAYPVAAFASILLYVWALILGYYAIREQFALNHVETLVLGLFALLLVSSTWHWSNHLMESTARSHMAEVAKRAK